MKGIMLPKTICCVIVMILFCESIAYSQKAIQLTNLTSAKKQTLKEGHRIQFAEKTGARHVGKLESITDKNFMVAGSVYSYDQLQYIGRK